jgi:adenine deaminase
MRTRKQSLLFLIVILVGLLYIVGTPVGESLVSLQDSRPIAIENVTVITMDRDRVFSAQTVIIRDGRISFVGSNAAARIPHDALRIDGTHRYLLPGLADMHAHLSRNHELSLDFLTLFVASGVTTILNTRGEPDHLMRYEPAKSVMEEEALQAAVACEVDL